MAPTNPFSGIGSQRSPGGAGEGLKPYIQPASSPSDAMKTSTAWGGADPKTPDTIAGSPNSKSC